MKMMFLEAKAALAAGNPDRAWELAQQDEGLLPGVQKADWLAYVEAIIAREKAAPIAASEREYL